jgi:hypothetical protein
MFFCERVAKVLAGEGINTIGKLADNIKGIKFLKK